MSRICVAIYDIEGQIYNTPFFVNTEAAAVRAFNDAICGQGQQNMYANYPEQFRLVKIAEFDDRTGKITPKKEETIVKGETLAAANRKKLEQYAKTDIFREEERKNGKENNHDQV